MFLISEDHYSTYTRFNDHFVALAIYKHGIIFNGYKCNCYEPYNMLRDIKYTEISKYEHTIATLTILLSGTLC
jgi:hypothetical protein